MLEFLKLQEAEELELSQALQTRQSLFACWTLAFPSIKWSCMWKGSGKIYDCWKGSIYQIYNSNLPFLVPSYN